MLIATSFLSFTIATTTSVKAGCGHHAKQHCCPECNHTCKLEAKEVEVEKKCYEIECETICVPRVVFPWQTGDCCWFPWGKKKSHGNPCDSCDGGGCKVCTNCVHNGATVRKIKVLKTKSYKCPECQYSWSVEDAPSCGCGDSGCCGAAGCCDSLPTQW